MEYFESDVPSGDGLCSDNKCPCPEVAIPRGTGYLYIDRDLVDFRRRYPRLEDARAAVREAGNRMAANGASVSGVFRLGPVLVCEQGAKLRGLDLEVAAADAKLWWESGSVPLRETPAASASYAPYPSDFREFEAADLAAAKAAAGEAFGAEPAKLEVVVLEKGSGGLFGLGRKPARIKARPSLLLAAQFARIEDVQALIASGADVRFGADGLLPILAASSVGRADVVRALLAAGVDPKKPEDRCGTALLLAASSGRDEVAKILVQAGTDVKSRDEAGATALTYAVQNGHAETVRTLLSLRADPNAKSDNGATALMMAVVAGRPDIVQALLAAGAKPNAEMAANGWTFRALDYALPDGEAAEGHYEVVRLLAKAGAKTGMDKPALSAAAAKGSAEAVRRLAADGANLNAKSNGRTALVDAAEAGHAEAVAALLAAGADPNAQDTPGWTALAHAAYGGHLAAVQALMATGADPSIRSKQGKTALALAKEKGNADVVRAMEAAGAAG